MHLFFECVVAREVWKNISALPGVTSVSDYLSVARLWICEKTHKISNIVHAAVLWTLWKYRNDLCFNRSTWCGMQVIYLKASYTLARWMPLCPEGEKGKLGVVIKELEKLARQVPRILYLEPG